MRFRLYSLLSLVTAVAVALGLLRGVMVEPAPYWGLYLVSLTSMSAGFAAIVFAAFDGQTKASKMRYRNPCEQAQE